MRQRLNYATYTVQQAFAASRHGPSTVAPSTPYSHHSRNNYAFLDERRSYKGPFLQEQRTQLVPNSSLLAYKTWPAHIPGLAC